MDLHLEERSSKGIVKDYFTRLENFREFRTPPFIHKTLFDMVRVDPILFTAVNLTVDLATHKGYNFLGDNKREIKRAKKMFDEELDFDQVIDNVLWQMIIYGNAYLEVRWNESKTKVIELHPLESSQMVINYTESGEIIGYAQRIDGKSEAEWPQFKNDEVIFLRQFWIGSQVYSYAPLEAIARPFSTRIEANNYLQSIFKNMAPKIVYFLKSANKEQRELFYENLIRAKTNPNTDIIATGEAFEAKLMEPSFDNGLIKVMEYLRQEILMITRVPPHWVGILDGANRGIGESVIIPYETKIRKIQQKVASQINRELLPKLGLSSLKFRWNAISLLDEKEIIANMAQLSAMRFDDESIVKYGEDRGLNLPEDASIKEELAPMMTDPQIQKDGQPSRQRAGKSDKMNSNLNKKGVSSEGKSKLKKAQGDAK